MGWTAWGSNPDWGEILRTRPDRTCGPPSLLHNGYRVFPGGKAVGRGVDHPITSSAKVKERVELYLYFPYMGRTACTEPQRLYKGDLYL